MSRVNLLERRLFIAIIAFAAVTSFGGMNGVDERTSNVHPEGKITFCSHAFEALPASLYVLDLATREIVEITKDLPIGVDESPGPFWGDSSDDLYFCVRRPMTGLCLLNRAEGQVELVVKSQPFRSDTAISFSPVFACRGSLTGAVYTIMFFGVPDRWGVRPLGLELSMWPEAFARRINDQIQAGYRGWSDIIAFDSGGSTLMYRYGYAVSYGVSVSNREDLIAFGAPTEVRVLNIKSGTVIVPRRPKGFDQSFNPAFSRRGYRLAMIASRNRTYGPSVVCITEGPGFDALGPVFEFDDDVIPAYVTWSPSDEWLLVCTRPLYEARAIYDLEIIHIRTGKRVRIVRPYETNGVPVLNATVGGSVDWIE
jgi:hypothetical protein